MTTLSSNYKLCNVMDDWHHLKSEWNIEYFQNDSEINCSDKEKCSYLNRYRRERGHEEYKMTKEEIDFKNIILIDQLDSIHAFIYHSASFRSSQALSNKYYLSTLNN
eukprot:415791_1